MSGADEYQTYFQSAIRAAFLAVSAFLILVLDPFGLEGATDRQAGDVFSRMMAPFHDSAGQDAVSVVLIDEAFLEHINSGWPLSYRQQAGLVRDILRHKPKALFIDLLYTQRREDDGLDTYANLLAAYNSGAGGRTQIPVLLAATGSDENILAKESAFQTPLVKWEGYGGAYPPIVGKEKTAALALYEIFCANYLAGQTSAQNAVIGKNCESAMASPTAINPGRFTSPLSLQWGTRVAELQNGLSEDTAGTCRIIAANPYASLWESLTQLWLAIVGGFAGEDRYRQPCPYFPTISPVLFSNDANAEQTALGDALTGKIVLLGINIAGINDAAFSPVHGQLPGVQHHAMALDNLILWGPDYYTPGDNLPWILNNNVVEALTLFFVMLLGLRLRNLRKRGGTLAIKWLDSFYKKTPLLCSWMFALTIATFPLLVATLYHLQYRAPPTNWVGIVGISVASIGFIFDDTEKKVSSFCARGVTFFRTTGSAFWRKLTGGKIKKPETRES